MYYCNKCGQEMLDSGHRCAVPKVVSTQPQLYEVLHDIGIWGIENNIAVTKIDKLKNIIVKHFG